MKRLTRPKMDDTVFDAANRLAWLLLAVDRFGSVGSFLREGQRLTEAGYLEKVSDEEHRLTEKGQHLVDKIKAARSA